MSPEWSESLRVRRAALVRELVDVREQLRAIDAELNRDAYRTHRERARVGVIEAESVEAALHAFDGLVSSHALTRLPSTSTDDYLHDSESGVDICAPCATKAEAESGMHGAGEED